MQHQRRKAQRGSDDRYITDIQKEDRRKRVETEKAKIHAEHDDEWNKENKRRRTFNPKRQVYKKRLDDDDPSTQECWRCGAEGHLWRQCFAASHVDGIHVYKKGEKLEAIAELHRVSVDDIKHWNHIESHKDLHPEQVSGERSKASGAKRTVGAAANDRLEMRYYNDRLAAGSRPARERYYNDRLAAGSRPARDALLERPASRRLRMR